MKDIEKSKLALIELYDRALNGSKETMSLIKWNDTIKKALERAKKVEELLKSYEVLVHDYEQLLETKDSKEWSLLRFHIIELKRIIDKRVEELK